MSTLIPHTPLIRDGYQLYTARAVPPAPPKAVVIIVHGYAEHSGSYHELASRLVGGGYAVYAIDHRGHGRSDGTRGLVLPMPTLANDLYAFLCEVKLAHAGLPLFIFAHSMGSLIALTLLLEHQQDVSGVILSGNPLLLDQEATSLEIITLPLLSALAPNFTIRPPDLRNLLSRDEAVFQRAMSDPLRYKGGLRAGTAWALLDGVRRARARIGELRLPLLVYHGKDDTLTPPGGCDLVYNGVSSQDKTIRYYENMLHEPHQEIEREQVFADVLAWLDARA
jgi:alpha-beta hydrolase superfamily lysophospholipase